MPATLLPQGKQAFETGTGAPAVGWKLYCYAAGTNTPQTTWSDAAQTASNPNPVIMDARGEATIFFLGSYKLVLKDNLDNTIWTVDNVIAQDIGLFATLAQLAGSAGSALIGFIQAGTGAVARTVQAKLRERVTPQDFGAVGDGVADDTAALNRFHLAISTGKFRGRVPGARYKFTSALTAITTNDLDIQGEAGATYLYTGASTTPGDLLTIGDGVTVYDRIKFKGVKIDSTTILTAGWGARIKGCRYVDIDFIIGDEYGTYAIYDGLWLEGVTDWRGHSTSVYTLNNGARWNNGFEGHCMNMYIKGRQANLLGYGFHVAGGCGGFYTENITQQFHTIGCQIDNTITVAGNLQMFLESGTFDVNKTASVRINDGTINAVGKIFKISCWMASTTTGPGLWIQNWASGKIAIGDTIITNNSSSGIYCEDANCIIEIGSTLADYNNGGYGIDASVPITVACQSDVSRLNVLGAISNNVTIVNPVPGTYKSSLDPTKGWARDYTLNTMAIANGGNAKLAGDQNTGGTVTISDDTSGHVGVYIIGGGAAALVSTTNASIFVAPTTTPAAGRASVQYNGATGYNVYNNLGGARTFRMELSKVRG